MVLLYQKKTVSDFLYIKKDQDELSNAGVNTYIQVFQHIDGCYKHNELPGAGFSESIKCLPKTHPDVVPLSEAEVEKLLLTHLTYANRNGVDNSELDFKYLSLTIFFIHTGCRFGEATSLKIKNLDIDNGRATLLKTKNKKNRFIFFKEPVKVFLRKLVEGRNPDDLVFTNSKGKNFYYGDYNDDLKKRARKAGITKDMHAHILRHTYATLLYNATHDITMVAKIIGHQDIQTTYETYVHLDTAEIERAANKHPLLAKYIDTSEVLENIRETIERLKIGDDGRFLFSINLDSSGLELSVRIKQ